MLAFIGSILVPLIIAVAAGILSAILFPKKRESIGGEDQLQTSNRGVPIPVLYGTRRFAGNVLWAGRLKEHITDKGEVRNRRSFIIGLCEGYGHIRRIWNGDKEYSASRIATFIANNKLYLFNGKEDNPSLQEVLALYNETDDLEFANYKNTCCAFFHNFPIRESYGIPNFTFEVGTYQWSRQILMAHDSYTKIFYANIWGTNETDDEYNLGSGEDVYEMAVANDGKYYVLTDKSVWRFHADNTLDTSWGTDGKLQISGVTNAGFYAIFCLANNSVVICGASQTVETIYKYSEDCTQEWKSVTTPDVGQDLYVKTVWVDESGERVFALGHTSSNGWMFILNLDTGSEVLTGTDRLVTTSNYYDPKKIWGDVSDDKIITIWRYSNNDAGGVTVYDLTATQLEFTSIEGCSDKCYYDADESERLGANIFFVTKSKSGSFTDTVIKIQINADDTATIITGYDVNNGEIGGRSRDITKLPNGYYAVVGGSYESDYDDNTQLWIFDRDLELIDGAEWDGTHSAGFRQVACLHEPASAGSNILDCNPAFAIKDYITNTRYGPGGAESIIDTESYHTIENYCNTNNLLFSFLFNAKQPIVDVIEEINSHFQGFVFESEGVIKFGAWREQSANATITQDHLLVNSKDDSPIEIKKREYKETCNRVEVTWTNRDKDYEEAVAIANDEIDQQISNKIRTRSVELSGICDATLAQATAMRLLHDSMYRFTNYVFKLGYQDMLLEQGDILDLSDGDKITNEIVRIISIEEAEHGKYLEITATEDKPYLYDTYSIDTTDSESDDYTDSELTSPTVNLYEDRWTNQVHINVAIADDTTTKFDVYISYDGTNYEYLDTVGARPEDVDSDSYGIGAAGTTTTALPACNNAIVYQSDQTVTVNIGTLVDLSSQSNQAFWTNPQLCVIENEIIGYQYAAETTSGSGIWELKGLIRGLYNTNPDAHAISSNFHTLEKTFSWSYSSDNVGQTIYFIICAANNIDQQEYNDSDITASSIQINGYALRPLPVSVTHIAGREGFDDWNGNSVGISWERASRKQGFNIGGFNYDGVTTWSWPNSYADLPYNDGIEFGAFEADDTIQKQFIRLEETDETLIMENSVAGTTEEVTLEWTGSASLCLESNDPAVIKVIPKINLRDTLTKEITIDRK